MGYRLDARLRALEQTRKQQNKGVIIVLPSPSGRGYISQQTGQKIDIAAYSVVIVNDIPKPPG